MYIGNNKISAIYKGSTKISALYKGSVKIDYGESGLTFYNWLKGDGKAYIATDYIPKYGDVISFKFYGTTENKAVYGSRRTMNYNAYCLFIPDNSNYYAGYSGSVSLNSTSEEFDTKYGLLNNEVELVSSSKGLWFNNLLQTIKLTGNNGLYPIYIFTWNDTGNPDSRCFDGYIGEFIVTRDGEVIHDYKPCDYNSKIGMYDTITGTFYGNSRTTGSFTVTNKIN